MGQISTEKLERAFEWLARRADSEFSEFDENELDTWLNQSEENRNAFERAEILWSQIDQIAPGDLPTAWLSSHRTKAEPAERVIPSRPNHYFSRIPLAVAACSLIAVSITFIFLRSTEAPPDPSVFQTTVAETLEVTLEDGSLLMLGAETKVSVLYERESRHAVLKSGEAFFEVASNPTRPFEVDAGALTVSVIGTQFEVSRGDRSADVAVAEGQVGVTLRGTEGDNRPEPSVTLQSGQSVRGTRGALSPVKDTPIANIGAWRRGELIYSDAPLSTIIADADRYFDGSIEILEPDVAEMTLTVILDARDTEGLLETLELALPIKASRLGNGSVLIVKRP